jgi:hypothetical protein
VIVVFSFGYLWPGKTAAHYDKWFIDTAINGREQISLPDDEFARSDLYECADNLGMFWGLPNLQAFHSIVPASIMEFYPSVGIKRDVSSKPDFTYPHYAHCCRCAGCLSPPTRATTLSRHCLISPFTTPSLTIIFMRTTNSCLWGFAYDYAVSDTAAAELYGEQRVRYMLHSLLLSDEAIVRNMDIIAEEPSIDYSAISDEGQHDAVFAAPDNAVRQLRY